MSANWSDELQVLDRVRPTRDLWADALARAASRQPPTRRRARRPSWMRSRRRGTVVLAAVALGMAGLAVAGVVAFAFSSSTAAAAYAVTANPDGSITITLRQFSALPALNRELAHEGLPLKAVPVTAHCAFNPGPRLPRGLIPFVPSEQGRPLRPSDTISIGTGGLTNGVVGVIGVGRNAGGLSLIYAGARSPGPSCVNSAAFYSPEVRLTPSTVSRGDHETLVAWVRPRPVSRCTITVSNSSGISHARGLYPKRPRHGRVSWTWRVATDANLGKHRVIVRCGTAGSLRTLFRVTN